MYGFFKSIFLALFPDFIISKWKYSFRKILALFYSGSKHYCPVEQKSYRAFIKNLHVDHIELLSPESGLLPRQRLLWLFLQRKSDFNSHLKVLHFSPNEYFAKSIKKHSNWRYFTSDFLDNSCNFQFDITAIDSADNQYDLIICYHVLEHIDADDLAFSELYRILKNGGKCFLQSPFKLGNTLEEPSYNTDALRLKHYNQVDHVRLYGIDDFQKKLNSHQFKVEKLHCQDHFSEAEIHRMGLNANEIVFLATK